MNRIFKRTKILATIGPATNSAEMIENVIMAGVNGCRLNCSHGSNEERDQQIKWIREAAVKKGRSVAILQDLQGPKIRLGMLKDNRLDLKEGDEVILEAKEFPKKLFSIVCEHLISQGVDCIVGGCTDISVAFCPSVVSNGYYDVSYLDSLTVLANTIVNTNNQL